MTTVAALIILLCAPAIMADKMWFDELSSLCNELESLDVDGSSVSESVWSVYCTFNRLNNTIHCPIEELFISTDVPKTCTLMAQFVVCQRQYILLEYFMHWCGHLANNASVELIEARREMLKFAPLSKTLVFYKLTTILAENNELAVRNEIQKTTKKFPAEVVNTPGDEIASFLAKEIWMRLLRRLDSCKP